MRHNGAYFLLVFGLARGLRTCGCINLKNLHAMHTIKHRPQSTFPSPFGDLMHEFLGRDIGQVFGTNELKRTIPGVNIVEREKEFELRLLAPGYAKQDLKLNMEDDLLTISAEKKDQALQENERYTRREFTHSAFSRSFKLPETVDFAAIAASYADGVLSIRIPKAEVSKTKAREISIS